MTAPERPPFRLAHEEVADLYRAHLDAWPALLAHVEALCASYRDQGLIEGDLNHDGTIRAEAAS